MKNKLYPLLAVVLSAVGFGLQYLAQMNPLNGRTDADTPAMIAVKVFFVAVPVIALLCALPLRGTGGMVDASGRLYENLNFAARFCGVLAGMIFCGGALLRLVTGARSGAGIAVLAVDVLLLAAGVSMVWQIVSPKPSRSLFALLPGFAAAFWLVIYYHTQSKDPIVERYGALLLCLMAMALACYHQAGYSFGRANPVRAMAFSLIGGIYAFTALPTAQDVAEALMMTAIGLWMLLHTTLLPNAPVLSARHLAEKAPE